MSNQEIVLAGAGPNSSFTARDLLSIIFRRKRIAAITFTGLMMGAVLAIIFFNPYKATTKFLVDRARLDPLVTPGQNVEPTGSTEITEEQINSEIELIKSGDVARQVVMACGLANRKSLSEYIFGPSDPAKKMEKAVAHLQGSLKVDPVNKSNVITATYTSSDPKQAAQVLRALGAAYMQLHKTVHTPSGQVEFFQQQTEQYKKQLADAEAQINNFSKEKGGISPRASRDLTLQKLSDFQSSAQLTQADIATLDQRIESLNRQATTTPERMTTAEWKEDSYQVLQSLKATMNGLQLKRTEYLTKYQPDYPLVQEVDKEIAQTQASIDEESTKPITQKTTDRNPTYAWINEELAKAKTERSGLQAKLASTQASILQYQAMAADQQQKGLVEQDLYRNMKTSEDNYLLYMNKMEQARMTAALDANNITNVSVAEQPVVPTAPYNSPAMFLIIGVMIAATASMGAVFAQEYLDPSFRTPSEVMAELNVPLLAAVPQRFTGVVLHGNGNGNGNGRHGRTIDAHPGEESAMPRN